MEMFLLIGEYFRSRNKNETKLTLTIIRYIDRTEGSEYRYSCEYIETVLYKLCDLKPNLGCTWDRYGLPPV